MSDIVDQVPPNRWSHVVSAENPADCASHAIFPSQLMEHKLWWTDPAWLHLKPSQWPKWESNSIKLYQLERKEICLAGVTLSGEPVVPIEYYYTFTGIQHVVVWILRFVNNCKSWKRLAGNVEKSCLTIAEPK